MSHGEVVIVHIGHIETRRRTDTTITEAAGNIQFRSRTGSISRFPQDRKQTDQSKRSMIPTTHQVASEETEKRMATNMAGSGRAKIMIGKMRKKAIARSAATGMHQRPMGMAGHLRDLKSHPQSPPLIPTPWSVRPELRKEFKERTSGDYKWMEKLAKGVAREDESATNTRMRRPVKPEHLVWRVRGKRVAGANNQCRNLPGDESLQLKGFCEYICR